MFSGFYLEGIVFIFSFVFCVLPKLFTEINMLKKVYPFLTLLAAGFMLAVQLLDFIPHMIVRHDHHSHDHHSHDHHSHDHHSHDHHSHGEHDHYYSQIGFFISGISFIFLLGIDSIILKHNHCEKDENENEECCNNNHNPSLHEKKSEEIQQKSFKSHSHQKHHNDQLGCCNTDIIKNSNSKAQAFIYILSISIHSFFEGLAFNNDDKIGNFEIGIILHKVLESFSIGLTLFSSNFSIWVALFLTGFYSFLTPLGMFIGNRYSGSDMLIKGIPLFYLFNGLALGSIMFIVCVEMIPSSFHKPGNGKLKIAVLTLGYLLSSIFIIKTHK